MNVFKILAECFDNIDVGLIVCLIVGAWIGIMAFLIPAVLIKYLLS